MTRDDAEKLLTACEECGGAGHAFTLEGRLITGTVACSRCSGSGISPDRVDALRVVVEADVALIAKLEATRLRDFERAAADMLRLMIERDTAIRERDEMRGNKGYALSLLREANAAADRWAADCKVAIRERDEALVKLDALRDRGALRRIDSELALDEMQERAEKAEAALAHCAAQTYCTMCGSTLDGYVPPDLPAQVSASHYIAALARAEKAEADLDRLVETGLAHRCYEVER